MIVYKDPNDLIKYTRWTNSGCVYNIWYEEEDVVNLRRNYRETDIDAELIKVLEECEEIIKTRKELPDYYPVKYAEIDFIYKEKVYQLWPETFGLEDDFDLEINQTMIRNKLKEIGVKYSRYTGMLD